MKGEKNKGRHAQSNYPSKAAERTDGIAEFNKARGTSFCKAYEVKDRVEG